MTQNIAPEVRERLEKLASYLESLPADYRHFDMGDWMEGAETSDAEVHYALHNGGVASCGTVACAAGHAPAAGILVPAEFIDHELQYVSWGAFAQEYLSGGDKALKLWMFAGAWGFCDNHHHGAAARIRYALEHGGAPKAFQQLGDVGCKWLPKYAPYRAASVDERSQSQDPAEGLGPKDASAVPAEEQADAQGHSL